MLGEVVGGRYRVLAKIGEGGHGTVYSAEQVDGDDRQVALKIMHEERQAGALERFAREAELVQRLSHPNNVRLLDFGVHANERPFSVFELLEGQSLQEILKREGPQSPARVQRIVSQVLDALVEAHSVGIVHRDIKPANILVVSHAGEADFVKVLDYGIAKSLRQNTKALTRQGEVLGTPSYMTPEHIEARPITPASDLYSLGLVMAEMLSGRRVFTGSPIDICVRQVSPSPVPLPPEVLGSPLGPVVVRATEKEVAKRFGSAAEMRDALRAAVAPGAAPPSPAPRKRALVVTAVVLVLALAALLAVWLRA